MTTPPHTPVSEPTQALQGRLVITLEQSPLGTVLEHLAPLIYSLVVNLMVACL